VLFSVAIDDVTCTAAVPAQVSTLGEWGLIAMAGILGIVGFTITRKWKVSAKNFKTLLSDKIMGSFGSPFSLI
jgi:hypothetical protein